MEGLSDRIEKQVEINASIENVWNALTDYQAFGKWFRVNLECPFIVGEKSFGQITYPGYEHVRMEVEVVAIEPMRRFAFLWHPYAIEPGVDYSGEPPTTVEFTLSEVDSGTMLKVIESGFDRIPEARRSEAFRMNEGGWAEQMNNIERYVSNDAG
ncbi:SRPBCC family protein [Stieleria sp. JC731]|uniref:SRPBCC family protein n=1 Tax=Pirellulaceae TaxID=2691357 RepID=UPI001E42F145|nr:SRPBCC family protein [Stieleria sp. JC731]MCC9600941.1 SRPBCC family protein [Stieleria sp. JC731]